MEEKSALNIIYKKCINRIGQELITARRAIKSDNSSFHLSSLQILRIVLLGCFFAESFQQKKLKDAHEGSNTITFSMVSDHIASVAPETELQRYLDIPTENLPFLCVDAAYHAILKSAEDPLFVRLLPYALELLEYSENDLLSATTDRRNGIVTQKKKQSGIFYTPEDVAGYMVNGCCSELTQMNRSLSECKFADFSCGSGVFLLQILEGVIRTEGFRSFHDCFDFIQTSLYGIDLSAHAVECARFSVFSYVMRRFPANSTDSAALFRSLTNNIIYGDATDICGLYRNHPDYPKSFDCIVGNPPYGAVCGGGNLFIPFVENLMELSANPSVSSLVLPLSFSYNNQGRFAVMRKKIQLDSAEWRIEHYDRSPDSLFGDDVKSRNCIVFRLRGKGKTERYVTGLLRWTSKTRAQILNKPKSMANITGCSISEYIPKLNGMNEWNAFQKLTDMHSPIYQHISAVSEADDAHIFMKGTAYNWICAYDCLPPCKSRDGDIFISKEMRYFTAKTEQARYFVLAMLNSVFSFWFWTVMGDGFHFTKRFLSSLHLGAERFTAQQYAEAAALGKAFCKDLKKYPYQTVNSGKVITNYDHTPLLEQAREIDRLISAAISLPSGFPEYLQCWYSNLVSCGRSPGTGEKKKYGGY